MFLPFSMHIKITCKVFGKNYTLTCRLTKLNHKKTKLKLKQMENKEQIQAFLLGWALGAIIFCALFAFVIRVERNHYNKTIEVLQKKCK
jgi:hypothetical protein